jgi:hypothetical protein
MPTPNNARYAKYSCGEDTGMDVDVSERSCPDGRAIKNSKSAEHNHRDFDRLPSLTDGTILPVKTLALGGCVTA